jgi:PPK2 family polyphosphate:nucleotide phosphotransferase
MKRVDKLARDYLVDHGSEFQLKDFDPADTGQFRSKEQAGAALQEGISRLVALQDKLYAQDSWAVLLIFQGMDAAGKDSAIKHVMSGVDPQGCQVYSFKQPTGEERNHDYLWRTTQRLPERRRIGIFNRSHYEEVLVVRVHPDLLKNEKLPPALISKSIWQERFEDICAFERYLSRNGILVRKFFLNLSKEEQAKRFIARLEEPRKNWKFSTADIQERKYWDAYMKAYEDMIRHTATPWAPWYAVPADHKWFSRLVVASAVIDALEGLNLSYPKLDADRSREVARARKLLKRELHR